MKRVIAILCVAVAVLSGCSASNVQSDSGTGETDKKDQYAIIHDFDNDADMTILPSNEYYDAVVEQLTYAAAEAEQVEIPGDMPLVKSLVFYQAPTSTASSDTNDDLEEIISVKIYYDGDKQYAVGSIAPIKNVETSFEMSDELIETINSMEQVGLQR